uniref:Uncharacterized protein n=1 Tax=Anguilla anguilla TaxID=7936 RepID=A0A0E9PRP0_ANGAN
MSSKTSLDLDKDCISCL